MKSKNSTIAIGVIQLLTSAFILGWIFSIWCVSPKIKFGTNRYKIGCLFMKYLVVQTSVFYLIYIT